MLELKLHSRPSLIGPVPSSRMLYVSSSTTRQLRAVASHGGGAGGLHTRSSSLAQCGRWLALQPVLQQIPVSNSSIEQILRACSSHSAAASA